MQSVTHRRPWRGLPWLAALLLLWLAGSAFAQQQEADPPSRVAHLSHRQGGVVFAPQGEQEWVELPQNRPLTAGDRLWSDRGARAELQLGTATLHVDGESHLGFSDIDERSAQFLLQQGSVNARVRDLSQGENFEIGTPNLAFRALQPGDYRVDVDPATGTTHVTVHSGTAAVFGEGGESIHLGAGQQASFAGRYLARVQSSAATQDAFGVWAAARNNIEDQSIAARHVPRGVIGATQLDQHGTWAQDPNFGTVWYPQVTVQDWAPYRHGHWAWIQPWGWTWIDDAPWGFAPFHYGRWTMLHNRWAWVPGRLAARPVYSPALVVFLGGGDGRFSLNVGSGPAVGWYPLAPGEAWWPTYRTSPRYVNFANFNINLNAYPRHFHNHVWRQRPFAVTAVREDDFRRSRPVYRHWQPLQPHVIGQAQVGVAPVRPHGRHEREGHVLPRMHAAPPAAVQPVPSRHWSNRDVPAAIIEQLRAQREQGRLQAQAERAAREQMRQAEEARRQQDVQAQREQMFRQQQESARQQQEAARHHHERAQREAWQQQRQQHERVREFWQRQREERGHPMHQPRFGFQQAQPAPVPQTQVHPAHVRPAQVQPAPVGGAQERGHGRREGRGDGRWHRDGDGHRGGGWQR